MNSIKNINTNSLENVNSNDSKEIKKDEYALLKYDLTKENKENITIDYRNSNYKIIEINIPEITNIPIKIKQDFIMGKGGIFWDGSYFLTKYFIKNYLLNENENNKINTILELGAGTALPSIVSLIKGHYVVTTDIPKFVPFMTDIIEINKNLYNDKSKSIITKLSWENKDDINKVKELTNNKSFDVIIGSELIYLDDLFDDLIFVLNEFSNKETLILMSYKIRLPSMVEDFMNKANKFFNIEHIDYDLKDELYPKPEKLQLIKLHKL